MLASDLIGAIASLALLVPTYRDFKQRYDKERVVAPLGQMFAPLRRAIENGFDRKRSELSTLDVSVFGVGAALLFVSFVLKTLNL